MENIILYTTHCPKCKILTKKLKECNIPFTENTNIEEMQKLGLRVAPYLSVNGELLPFADAVRWVKEQEVLK